MLDDCSRFLLVASLLVVPCASAETRSQPAPDLGLTVRRLSPRAAVVDAGPWNNSYLAIAM